MINIYIYNIYERLCFLPRSALARPQQKMHENREESQHLQEFRSFHSAAQIRDHLLSKKKNKPQRKTEGKEPSCVTCDLNIMFGITCII